VFLNILLQVVAKARVTPRFGARSRTARNVYLEQAALAAAAAAVAARDLGLAPRQPLRW